MHYSLYSRSQRPTYPSGPDFPDRQSSILMHHQIGNIISCIQKEKQSNLETITPTPLSYFRNRKSTPMSELVLAGDAAKLYRRDQSSRGYRNPRHGGQMMWLS